jgi:Ca-activated chloride channel family protein
MTFIWPQALVLLLLVPLGIGLDRLLDRRRRRGLESLGGLRPGATSGTTGRRGVLRRVPPVLFVLGMLVLVAGLARPQEIVGVPHQEGTVILAFDVSGSMAATDLTPTRMDAAKAAAKDFVSHQPASVVIGVVAFSDSGVAAQQPTNDQAAVVAAIDRLTPQKGTSVGRGIQASLDVIAAAAADPNYYTLGTPAPTPSPTPVPAGTHAPAVIVLLTDGENNEQPDPAVAAQAAVDRGVRIFTIGIGSPGGADLDLNGFTVHTQLDEATLQQIADTTGGTYFGAADAASLLSIYDHLDTNLVVRQEDIELTAIVAAAGLVLLVLGGLASLRWLGRVP